MKRVLVIGGGIGGVEAAIALRQRRFDVTLISDRDFFFIYPLSIWIPTREIPFAKATVPLQKLADAHGFHLVLDAVTAIHAAENRVTVASGADHGYDYLVIALGADKVKHPGVEYTISTCGKPEDSLTFRDRLDALVERGSGRIAVGFGGNPKDESAVRGGPAFELIFNIHHLLERKGMRNHFELSFFAPMAKPGARMGERAADGFLEQLRKMGWNVNTGKKIKAFAPDGVTLEDDTRVEADLTVFIPAGAGKPLFRESGLPVNEAGFITTDEGCQVPGFPNVYAVGDSAALLGPKWRAKQGHVAEMMARTAAANIAAADAGSAQRSSYVPHVNILCVMDTGNGAFWVSRNDARERALPLPVVGHALKKGWGLYYTLSKLGKIPRIPGL